MRFSLYITAHAIAGHLADRAGISTAIDNLRVHHIDRVFLEARRASVSIPESMLLALQDDFERAGFQTAGGMMPIGRGGEFGKPAEGIEVRNEFLCYSADETAQVFEREIRKMARIFKTIILDDAFLTPCRCQRCKELRASLGNQDWGVFRRELLTEFSRNHVIAPAKDENPNVSLIIKFPQYYDRYSDFGYDPAAQSRLYDGVWAGTETRDPSTPDYGYVPPYEAVSHVSYLRSIAGEKLQGAWFDSLDCTPGLFQDQAVLTALSGVPEMTVFCYSPELFGPSSNMTRCLRDGNQKLRDLSDAARLESADRARTVVWYRPPLADGGEDLFIPDFLGMWAIPIITSTKWPIDARVVLLSTHALSDPHPAELIEALEEANVRIIVTTGFLRGLHGCPVVRERFGVREIQASRIEAWTLRIDGREMSLDAPLAAPFDIESLPGLSAIFAVTAPVCDRSFQVPLWLEADDTHAVLNMRTFGRRDYTIAESLNIPIPTSYATLPDAVVSRIRAWCLQPLGFDIDAPNWTCTVPLGGRRLAIVRPHTSAATVRIAWNGEDKTFAIPSHDVVIV